MVLHSFSCVGDLVPVARSAIVGQTLLEHLEDIVAGSHPSLGDTSEYPASVCSCVPCSRGTSDGTNYDSTA